MKISKLAIAVALWGALSAGTVWAEELRQPASVRQAAFDYDNYRYFTQEEGASESSGVEPATAADESPGAADCGEPSCCGSCDSCERCSGCDLGDPWTLPQPNFLECRGITIGGWVSAGIFGNAHGAADNGPLGFNNVGDGFTFNQLWVFAEKVADTGGCGTDWGIRFDYVFGVDGPDTQAFGDGGWDFGWDSARDYGSAIPQLYLELAVNDLSLKLGHFYTIIGWEVVTAPDNFFYSHAYTMYYAKPFTHTGFLAEWAASDRVTVYGGWTAGWDSGWENLNDASTFLGGVGLSLSENASLTWALTAGDFGAGAGDIYMNSIVLELSLTDNLTYILQHDLGDNSGLGAGDNEWYGINQYLQYQINDCWAAGLRFEWFRDDDGTRVVANNDGNYYGLTAGVNWKPHANLIFRPEIRYDWYDGNVAGGHPFNEGRDDEQFSGGFDFIVTF